MKYESDTSMFFKRYRPETIFPTEIKGHNADDNRWILSVIKLELYFMIIYLCMKFESHGYDSMVLTHGADLSALSCKWSLTIYQELDHLQTYYQICNELGEYTDSRKPREPQTLRMSSNDSLSLLESLGLSEYIIVYHPRPTPTHTYHHHHFHQDPKLALNKIAHTHTIWHLFVL